MARPKITDVIAVGDFMVSNLWDIEIVAGYMSGVPINIRAVSFELPKRTGASLEVNIRGHKIKQPGDYEYSNETTLTLSEDEDTHLAHEMIRTWRNDIIQLETNNQMKKADIVAEVFIRRLNRDGSPSGLSWILHQCYLESYELGELNEEGAIIQPTITLSYDWFEDFVTD